MRSRQNSSYNLKPQDTGRIWQESPRSHQARFYTGGGSSDHNEQRMRQLKQRGLMKFILRKMERLIPLTTPRVPVFEEWEGTEEEGCKDGEMDNRSFDEKVSAIYPIYQVFCFIRAITLLLFLWASSIDLAFQDNVIGFGVLILMLVMVIDLLSKGWLAGNHHSLKKCLKQSKIKEVGCPILVSISCILMLSLNMIQDHPKALILAPMGLIVFIIAPNLFAYFEIVKTFAERKKLIKQMRIVELFCVLFLLAHIFGLILFSATKLKPQTSYSWIQMDSLHLRGQPWWVQYIYAVYWAMTTITTVGYGDITPQNYVQILVVMIIQICGASFFGYMMSVIGDIVDQKNAKNEEYDNYQQTITKLRDHYNLTSQLTQSMKSDIKEKYNKQKTTPLRKAEQEQFLDYLDPLVRRQFIHQTNIRIIKKSIFFLTYFTVHFQNQIALKLIRAIYKKDDGLLTIDAQSKQRKLIIINNGKINLFIQKRHNNISCQKLVKTIQTYEGKPTLNVYGYSAMIMDKNISLFARADALTSAYELLASDVLEIISKNMIDYQTFHEMRQKMLISPIKQSIQAPILNDSTFHYTPNIFILSKKQNKKFYQCRVKRQRDQRRKKLELIDVISIINFKRKLSFQPTEQQAKKLRSIFQKKSLTQFQQLMSIQQISEKQPFQEITLPIQRKSNELCLDQIKIFDRFMRAHNISNIAAKYELSCRSGSYRKRILTTKLMHS